MADAYLKRAISVVGVGIDSALGAVERLSADGLLRQSIRDIDKVIDDLDRERDKATREQTLAANQARRADGRGVELGEQARFALSKGRDDLAQEAVSRQLAAEAEAQAARDRHRMAGERLDQIDEMRADAVRRRQQLDESYRPERQVGTAFDLPRTTEQRVDRAERAFARHLTASAGGVTGVADIAALARADEVQARLDAIRGDAKPRRKTR